MGDGEQEQVKPRRGRPVEWRRDPVILARLPLVEERHLRGAYNTVIARELGVDERTVRSDLKRLNELWLEQAGAAVDDMRARRFAELELVKREAMRSFDFDMEAIAAVLYGAPVKSADGETRYVQRDDDGRVQYKADKVAALAQYRQAVMDQAKLYGLVIEKVDVAVTLRQEAARIAKELGLDEAEVIAEAEALLKGTAR